jgi:hypothetical protein
MAEHVRQLARILFFGIEPGVIVARRQNDGHPMVKPVNRLGGRSRQDRTRL